MAQPSGVIVIRRHSEDNPQQPSAATPFDKGISEFSVAEAADVGVGFDGFGAVRAFAGACGIAESAFLEGTLVIFNDLLDALRIPFCVAVAVDLVGPA